MRRDERRKELAAQPFRVDAQRHEAGQLVARGEAEAQLRLKIRGPAVDGRLEERDGVLLGRELLEARYQHRGLRHVGREVAMLAVVGEHLVAVLDRQVGPHVVAIDERLGVQAFIERRRDEREIEGFGLRLRHAQQHVDVGRLERVLQALRDAVGSLLTQLAQDDGRRLAQRGDRAELKVEEAGNRNRNRDGQRRCEPDAAITE